MSGKCGRCRGRGSIKPTTGFEMGICPDCEGRGVKVQKASLGRNRASIPLPPGAMCVVCGDAPAVQMHHLCKQQRIEREVPAEQVRAALTDPRGGIPICLVNGCHGLVEEEDPTAVAAVKLPTGFWDYVDQFNLYPALPRWLVKALA